MTPIAAVSVLAAACGAACLPRAPGSRLTRIAGETTSVRNAAGSKMHSRPRSGGRRSRNCAIARSAAVIDVPLLLDLIAVCIAAGASPAAALAAVARGMPDPLGSALVDVSRALALGASAAQAWIPFATRAAALQRAAEAFAAAELSGAALAPALMALADDERRAVQRSRARAARRVGVLAAAPLGLCFLPAFILTGVVPVIAGLVSRLSLG